MRKVEVNVGNVVIGNGKHIVIQTMCNTPTQDIESSLKQCIKLYEAGAEIIRLTTQGMREVEALKEIKSRLRKMNMSVPLVADVHFSSNVAIAVAEVADKVRINPGNFAKQFDVAAIQFAQLVKVCKNNGTALRIGVNHGSLGDRIIEKFGDTPVGMAKAAMEWIEMAQINDFDQIVISLKSSNTRVMVDAYRMLYQEMAKTGILYPIHLGVTEAGNGEPGRIKSAVGISTLLSEGIGDTIRVSLTEDPVNELPVAKLIASFFEKDQYSSPLFNTSIRDDGTVVCHCSYKCNNWNYFVIRASCELGPLLLDKKIDDISVELEMLSPYTKNDIDRFRRELLQASRRVFFEPEYVACPGCGRTLFNIESVFSEVKKRTAHLKGYVIAVMGCIVNGPGEMADADYGYVGEGKNKVSIYRGKELIFRAVPEEIAIDKLLELIESDAKSGIFMPHF